MKPDLPNDDRKQSSQLGIPFARCPKGHWIYSQGQLPEMPIPSPANLSLVPSLVGSNGFVLPQPFGRLEPMDAVRIKPVIIT